MSWESWTTNAARTQLNIFGESVNLLFADGKALKTKTIVSPQTTYLKDHHGDFEAHALVASISKHEVQNPQEVIEFHLKEKRYQVIKYQVESDAFISFFLSE
jgi:hypothetical protein